MAIWLLVNAGARISFSWICGNKMPTRCNRGFYCRSYWLLNILFPHINDDARSKSHQILFRINGRT